MTKVVNISEITRLEILHQLLEANDAVLVTPQRQIPESETQKVEEATLLAEAGLQEWNSVEEDEAWSHLQ